MIAGARVVVHDRPNWPPGGAALAIRGSKVVVLLQPGLSRPEQKSALKWARDELRTLEEDASNQPSTSTVYWAEVSS